MIALLLQYGYKIDFVMLDLMIPLAIVLLAGISTNSMGKSVTAKELFACVEAVSDVVSGFWLNIPAASEACPTCGEPKPEIAEELLKMISETKK